MNVPMARISPLGARPLDGGRCRFTVWAPHASTVEVEVLSPNRLRAGLAPAVAGYFSATLEDVPPGSLYRYRLDRGSPLPDPASRLQPQGVDGASAVVDTAFPWSDGGWLGIPMEDLVLYELHVGTFTPHGTFDAAAADLPRLRDLGVTAIEIMPVSAFPGERNWGYDGVFPFAVQASYGGPSGLQRFVDACHRQGLAVIVDMVYNHLGPEGNVLQQFGPYFTDRYRTPWGEALNFDGRGSDQVRRYFLEQALSFLREYHVDGFRLDAVAAIVDQTPCTFLEEFNGAMHAEAEQTGRHIHVIAEDDRNDPRLVRLGLKGGIGFDAVWNDDLHHALHALLTGETSGYYRDYGGLSSLARVLSHVFARAGGLSLYRGRRHGRQPDDVDGEHFVAFVQNHDQVGNRCRGERLGQLVPFEATKLAAALLLLSPFRPMLFMGEEYGEQAPFLYFTSHRGEALVQAVREGRKREFADRFGGHEPPDPQAEETFVRSKLAWPRPDGGQAKALQDLYRELLRLRRDLPAVRSGTLAPIETDGGCLLGMARGRGAEKAVLLANLSGRPASWTKGLGTGLWSRVLDTSDTAGVPSASVQDAAPATGTIPLAPFAAVLFRRRGSAPTGPGGKIP